MARCQSLNMKESSLGSPSLPLVSAYLWSDRDTRDQHWPLGSYMPLKSALRSSVHGVCLA